MPSFRYSGVSASGRSVGGVVEADNPRSARATLRERNVFATSVTEVKAEAGARGWTLRRGVSTSELAQALRQLATLLRAGVPLDEAVDALRRRRGGAALGEALEAVRTRIREGASLAAAMADHPTVFPSIYTGMVEAGEASGALDAVLERIAAHAEAQSRLRSRLIGAMTYPALLSSVGAAIVIFLLAYVVPQVTRIFAERKQTLPLPTRMLMGIGDFLAHYGLLLIPLGVLLALGLRRALTRPQSRQRLETLFYRVPVLGTAARDIAVARFAQTLATLVGGGLPLVESLRVARGSSGSLVLSETLAAAETSVFEGGSLASCMAASPLFDPVVVDMVAVGERSGDLDGMLTHAAAAIEEQVRLRVDRMADMLGPITTLAMAGVVLFVMLAIMLPIFDMNRLVH
ncbi:MAG TPA: type II secretion system F family protein [Candidatus Binatia bacterium]